MDLEDLNKKEISRNELERLYKELEPSNIIDLYNDKNEYTPSKLSDMLFKAYDDLDGKINDLSTKEILDIIYKYSI